jgi:hypothetical protein
MCRIVLLLGRGSSSAGFAKTISRQVRVRNKVLEFRLLDR